MKNKGLSQHLRDSINVLMKPYGLTVDDVDIYSVRVGRKVIPAVTIRCSGIGIQHAAKKRAKRTP